ncbi:MAG: hypothetical protein ACMUHY_09310 [Thermoplasmatota archaeon]
MEGNARIRDLLIVTLLVASGLGVLFAYQDAADGYVDECITEYGTSDGFPAVDGPYMVYETYVSGESRVILRNIETGNETKIVNFNSYAPDISGDRIVFLSDHGGNIDVYEYRISSGTWNPITNNAMREFSPRIDGEDTVWYEDQPGHDLSVIHHNPGTGIRKLSSSADLDLYPNIQGGLVVWESYDPGYSMIKGYDLHLGTEFDVFDGGGTYAMKPDIYGDRLVFVMPDGPYELVHLYNTTTGLLRYVSNRNYRSDWPRVDRENVVFTTLYDEGWDVCLYKIEEDMKIRLTHDSADELYPIVWGEHVAYTKNRFHFTVHYILLDYDNDGIPDQKDMFPYNPTENFDTDEDGRGDNIDPDNDNDGVLDEEDAFPYDDSEWSDFDGDGVGDNADEDDDNDNIPDNDDVFPFSDINPIMDLLLLLQTAIEELHADIMDRLDTLETTLIGLIEENAEEVGSALGEAVMALSMNLTRFNFSHNEDMIMLAENLTDMLEGQEAIDGGITDLDHTIRNIWEDPFFVDSFFDVFVEVDLPEEETYFDIIVNRSAGINETMERLAEMRELMTGLQEIDDMVANLETVSRNIEDQNEDLETSDDNMRLYFIVLIVIMAIYAVIMIAFFMRMSRKDAQGALDEY